MQDKACLYRWVSGHTGMSQHIRHGHAADSMSGSAVYEADSACTHAGAFVAIRQATAQQAGAAHGGAWRAASAVSLLLAPYLLCLRLPTLLLLTGP